MEHMKLPIIFVSSQRRRKFFNQNCFDDHKVFSMTEEATNKSMREVVERVNCHEERSNFGCDDHSHINVIHTDKEKWLLDSSLTVYITNSNKLLFNIQSTLSTSNVGKGNKMKTLYKGPALL